jgi:uncharacterized membrane protein
MRKYVMPSVIAFILMVTMTSGLFAQASAGGRSRGGATRVTLQVESNPRGANVYINNELQEGSAPISVQLTPGTYTVRVTAKGYDEFVTTINLTGNQSIRADLQQMRHTLRVNSNVQNAQVYLDNNRIGSSGTSTALAPGTYTVQVRADGYQDYSTRITLNSDQTINAVLQQIRYTLRVNSNVQNAQVYLDNNRLGSSGTSTTLTPGTYSIQVRADGYQDYSTRITLNSDQTITATLQPLNGKLSLEFPNNTANVFYYVNGTRYQVNSRSGRSDVELPPGNYRIKYSAGGIESPELLVTVQAGQTTNLKPVLGFE